MLDRATADGKVFEDTKERGKPIVFRYGSRPFTGGLCQGVEEAISNMRAGADLSLPTSAHLILSQYSQFLLRRCAFTWKAAKQCKWECLPSNAKVVISESILDTGVLAWAGGIRVVTVPPQLGFGDQGAMLRPTEHVPEKQGEVPPGATLEYELNLIRVSIPPS